MDAPVRSHKSALADPSEWSTPALLTVVGATVGMLIGPTSIIAPPIGLFMPAVSQEFGLGRAGFPLLMLMVSIFAGLCSPLAGRLIDRVGVRRVILPAVTLFGLAEIALSQTKGSFAAFLFVFALTGILAGIQNPTAYTKLLALWFERRRGLMVSIACAVGSGGGGILIPQLTQRLISAGGWQWGYAGLGIFILLGAPIVYLLLKEPRASVRKTASAPVATDTELPGLSRGQAMKTRPFWTILIAMAGVSASLVALSVHVPAWIADAGGSTSKAAAFLSLFAAGSVVSQVSSGILLDRINSPKVGALFFGLAFVGAFLLRGATPDSNALLLYAFLIGTGLGAELGMACYFISRYFGFRSYGEIYGSVYGTLVMASGLGPVLMGLAFEHFHVYLPTFNVAAGILLVSTILIFLLPPYVFAVKRSPLLVD